MTIDYEKERRLLKVGDIISFLTKHGRPLERFRGRINYVSTGGSLYFNVKIIEVILFEESFRINQEFKFSLRGGIPWRKIENKPFTDDEYKEFFI